MKEADGQVIVNLNKLKMMNIECKNKISNVKPIVNEINKNLYILIQVSLYN